MNRLRKLSLLIIFLLIIVGIFTACTKTTGVIKVSFTVDGNIYREYNLEYGSGLDNIPSVPEKKGYIGQWNIDDFSEFYKDTTITAVYTKNFFTVTFRADNFIVRSTDVILGENPSSLPPIPPKEGFNAVWEITDFTQLTVDTIVKAVYTPITITITFKSEGNDDIIRYVDYGSDLTDIPSVPEKEEFTGVWDKTDFTSIKAPLTVNAEYSPRMIIVNYIDADDNTERTRILSYKQHLPLPAEQTKSGFIFNGWYTDSEYENKATSSALYNDLNVYAYWIAINDLSATNPQLFQFTALDDGSYEIAPLSGVQLPSDIILPNSYSGKLVTRIGNAAFKEMAALESIVIPVGVTEIGAEAFYGCDNLAEITFASRNRLNNIGDYAFYRNSSLVTINIAKDIEYIGNYAFYECSSLRNLNIPATNNLKDIGNYAFANSSGINELNISENIVTIGDYAFSALYNTVLNFKGLEILESVGKFAFRNCSGLTSFNAPHIISIGEGAFTGCMYLSELTILADIPIADYFGQSSFQNSYEVSQISRRRDINGNFILDGNGNYELITINRWLPISLKTIRIREGVTNVADYTLNNCVAVNNIYIPGSVRSIGRAAFAAELGDSRNLMSQGALVFGNNSRLEEIGDRAFYARTSFNAIILPASVKSIGNEAFRIATNLSSITVTDSDNLEYIGSYAVLNTNWHIQHPNGILYLGNIAIGYKGALASNVNVNLMQGTKSVAPYAFSGISSIVSVNIPSSVKVINEYAFFDCPNIHTVTISEGVHEIKRSAFERCVNLRTITIPKSVETIGRNILRGCNNLATMNVYGDRTAGDFFGKDEYSGSYLAQQKQIAHQNYEIVPDVDDNNRFYLRWEEVKNLYNDYPDRYNIVITNSIDQEGNTVNPFILTYVTHNNYDSGFYQIVEGKYIFSVTLIRSQISLGVYRYITTYGAAFISDTNIQNLISVEAEFNSSYYIPQTLKKIVFINDADSEHRVIKPYSFMNMTSLEEIVLAEGISEIGKGAFLNCISLGNRVVDNVNIRVPLIIPSSLRVIGQKAFENNASLKEINYASGTKLEIIEKAAFKNSGLLSLYIPSSVRLIGEEAFSLNYSLAVLTFENAAIQIDNENTILNSLVIGNQAFYTCSSISNIAYPDRLTEIGGLAFARNTSLSSVMFGLNSQLVAVGQKAFEDCSAMISIRLPEKLNLDTVGDILSGCSGIREISLYNTDESNYHSSTLGMLFGTEEYARSYEVIQDNVTYYIPNTLTTINLLGGRVSDYLLQNVTGLKLVNLQNITQIGNYSFDNCVGIEKIDLPDTVTKIGSYAFHNCSLMASFNIDENSQLVEIGESAFRNNVSLENFSFPSGVTVISSYTFYNCVELLNVDIDNIIEIQDYAFYDCKKINLFDFSENLTFIGNYAFYNCSYAEFIYKKFDMLTNIGSFAFYNCLGLKYVHAENIESTGIMAYSGAYNLEELSIPGNTALGPVFGSAYYENSYSIEQNGYYFIPSNLKRIRISSKAISLPSYAFKDCHSVSDIVFLSSVPPVLGNNSLQNTSDNLKLFVPYNAISLYIMNYSEHIDRIFSNPSDLEQFLFILNNDNTYTISATDSYNDTILYIPSSYNGLAVTRIAEGAFKNHHSIKEVIIPNTIIEIAFSAFKDCINIERVIFEGGSKLATIANDAFSGCNSLISIRIPASVETIGDYAFAGRRYLNVQNEYIYTSSLAQIVFEENSKLRSIGNYAFYLCNSLTFINIPSKVETIGKAAFRNSGLVNIIFPKYSFVSRIEAETFYGCQNLISIELPYYIQIVDKNAFSNCSSLTQIKFNDNLQIIGERAFYNCISLINLELPNSVTTIEKEAFRYCTTLERASLVGVIEYIGDYAFNGCSSLFEVNISNNHLLYIGEFAFADTLWYQNHTSSNDDQEVIYINNIAYAYKGVMPSNTTITLREGTVAVSPNAFAGQTNLTGIIIPDSVTIIGEYAFNNCASLNTITFSQNSQLERIGKGAFLGTALQSLTLPNSLTYIGEYAFYGITTLSTMVISEGLETIGKYAFAELLNLDADIALPQSLVSLGDKAFYNNLKMTVTIPSDSSLTFIGNKAFSYTEAVSGSVPVGITVINDAFSNTTITTFVIPVWITKIDKDAFRNSVITQISLAPNNMLFEIGESAFYNLGETNISLNGLTKLKSIGNNAFFNCLGLQKLVAAGISSIGNGAFEGCNSLNELSTNGRSLSAVFNGNIPISLTTINIAAGVTQVEEGAFENISSIVTLNFAATIRSISRNAFKNAVNLQFINFEISESLEYVGKDAFLGTKWLQNCPVGAVYLGKLVYSYKDNGTNEVNILAGTTAIAEYAFYNTNIQSVFIPISVTSINDYAFAQCANLTSITFANGSSLTRIGDYAFNNCIGLTTITLPLNVNSIGTHILKGCSAIINLNYNGSVRVGYLFGDEHYDNTYIAVQNGISYYIPNSLANIRIVEGATKISAFAMQNCTSIETVIVSISIEEIQESAFDGCVNMNRLSIINGSQLKIVGDRAFADCSSLTGLSLPSGAVYVGQEILSGSYSFTELTFNGKLQLPKLFGKNAFPNSYEVELDNNVYYLPNTLKSVVIASGTTEIEERAFAESRIESVSIPLSVQTINSFAFSNATELINVNIASNSALTTIKDNAFSGCIALTSIVLHSNVEFIGDRAFYNCIALANIIIMNSSCQTGNEAFANTLWLNSMQGPSYIGNTFVGYNGVMPLNYYLTLRAGTTDIASYALAGQQNLVSVTIPSTVKTIGEGAFKDCVNLLSVTFNASSSLTAINKDVFNNSGLQNVSLPSGINTIGERAFYNTLNLKNVVFAQNSALQTIGKYAFAESGVLSVIIPRSVTLIDDFAFSNSSAITEVIFEQGSQLETIGVSAFYNLMSANFIGGTLNNLLEISDNAFYNCSLITKIIAPLLETIGDNSFYGCYSVQEITLPQNTRLMDIFGYCSVETQDRYDTVDFDDRSFTIPKSLETVNMSLKAVSVMDSAFYLSASLKSVYLTANIKEIEENAFRGCSSLIRIVGGINLATIGKHAFIDCTSLLTTKGINHSQQIFELTNAIRYIGDGAFDGCTGIQKFVIAGNSALEYIGSYAFNEMQSTVFEIAPIAKPLSIGQYAFNNNKLLEIFEANNVISIGVSAFSGCSNLTKLSVTTNGFVGAFFSTSSYENSYEAVYQDVSYYIPLSLKEIIVSSAMTNIADYAFSELVSIELINLAKVTSIGSYAFNNNLALNSIIIPQSVVIINDFAFSGCSNLNSVQLELEDTLTYIGEAAFDDTHWYINSFNDDNQTIYIGKVAYKHKGEISGRLTIAQGTIGISPKAFINKNNITELHLPLSLSTIGNNAFQNCNSIETIYTTGNYEIGKLFGTTSYAQSYQAIQNGISYFIPLSLRNIHLIDGSTQLYDNAFANLSSVTAVTLPASINKIGFEVFNGCNNISTMTLSSRFNLGMYFGLNPYEGSYAAEQNGDIYYIPSSLKTINVIGTEISANCYQNLSQLTTVNISSSITRIGDYAFAGCSKLTGVNLQNVNHIGRYAFAYCSSITRMDFPAGATLSENILSGCYSINTLQLRGNSAIHLLFGTAHYQNSYAASFGNRVYYIPTTLTTIYVISTTMLVDGLMQNFTTVSNITIPSNITRIGSYAFYGLELLDAINLPSTLIEVGDYAFYNNKQNVISIAQNNIQIVGANAFSNCFRLTKFVSSSLVSIGTNAFSGCFRLTELTVMRDKIIGRYFGQQMFVSSYAIVAPNGTYYAPTALINVTVYGEGALPDYMFAGMSYLKSVIIHGETEIPQNAFYGCTGITDFVGDNIVYIAEDALISLPWLALYFNTFSNEVVYIGKVAYAHVGSQNVLNVNLREDTTQLYKYALANLSRIVNLNITANIRYIDITAFSGCNSLSAITVDESNTYYSSINGKLYNKAGDTLIFSPPANI